MNKLRILKLFPSTLTATFSNHNPPQIYPFNHIVSQIISDLERLLQKPHRRRYPFSLLNLLGLSATVNYQQTIVSSLCKQLHTVLLTITFKFR
ncbi:hypothetical protein CEXT_209571 [Caerostris extrusa]|uniref:Uncharacterized protein n=1 Tax=Caerostris extrusa TaxID=172846 RepID=A0AAV4S1V2_CAEEX|nr:hypothetical protein CEXT_209571 [Caerostris extrusa]